MWENFREQVQKMKEESSEKQMASQSLLNYAIEGLLIEIRAFEVSDQIVQLERKHFSEEKFAQEAAAKAKKEVKTRIGTSGPKLPVELINYQKEENEATQVMVEDTDMVSIIVFDESLLMKRIEAEKGLVSLKTRMLEMEKQAAQTKKDSEGK